ncbi:MAG: hypothetical protein DLM69_03510 [Candidatus Chloroheliales bacterium]|nr:MAG: hypothetical protein DLM69_03510 [Chloroflexota bacterium]
MKVSRANAAIVLSNAARERMRAQLFKSAPIITANPTVPARAAAAPLPATPLHPAARGALFNHPLARAALVLLVLAALFVGVGAAAARTVPGDTLYPVKRLYEGIRVQFSFNDYDKATAHLDFVSTRLDEIEALFQHKTTIGTDLFTDLDDNVSYCTAELNSSSFSRKQQLASALGAALQREQQVLTSVSSGVATDARQSFKTALDRINSDYRVATQYAPSLPPLATPVGTPALPAAEASPTPLLGGPTPTGAATATDTPAITNTPTITATSTPQPSATSTLPPSATSIPRPKPSNTPQPPYPTPTALDRPSPTATDAPKPPETPTPFMLKPTATPVPPRFKPTPTPAPAVPSPPQTGILQPLPNHPTVTPPHSTFNSSLSSQHLPRQG